MTATLNKLPVIKSLNPLKLPREFSETPLDFLMKYKAIYGDTYISKMVNELLIVTASPVWFKHILQTNHKDFGRGLAYIELKLALGNGLLVNEG